MRFQIRDQDIIYVDGDRRLLEDLHRDDEVEISSTIDPTSHKLVQEIHATRPGKSARGKLRSRDDSMRTIVLEDETNHQDLKIFVPAELTRITLNGQQTFQGKPVTLASLNPGEALRVGYDYRESGNVARWLEASRQVEFQGVLAEDFDGRALERDPGRSASRQAALRRAIRDLRQQSAGGETYGIEARRSRQGET